MSPPVLLTGASGLLGRHLQPALVRRGEVIGLGGPGSSGDGLRHLDLADAAAVVDCLDQVKPAIVVHAAAMANVDACERHPALAWKNNVLATRNLIDWCIRQRAAPYFVYISTDQLYDGPGPHDEAAPNPINVYALTKLWAEDLIRQLPSHLILRLNYVALPLPDLRRGFVSWLIDSLSEGRAITLFDDVFFNPLYAADAVELLAELVEMRAKGLLNFGASGAGISKAGYGLALAEMLGLSRDAVTVGSVAQSALAAARPQDMRMGISRLSQQLGRTPPDIQAGLRSLAKDWRIREFNQTIRRSSEY
jgi:dTDP-4-dehydrorhamnose reductase